MSAPTDQQRLAGYIDVWWRAVDDFTSLLEEVPAEEWSTPTDLAGWDVRAVASHTAHLESILAGAPEETAEVGEPEHVTGLMGLYTEIGVVNRRDSSPDEIINEIRSVTTARHTALLADPPTDGVREARGDLRRRRRGTGRRCCATGRSTSGCTSRTYAARSAARATSTPRRPSTPPTT